MTPALASITRCLQRRRALLFRIAAGLVTLAALYLQGTDRPFFAMLVYLAAAGLLWLEEWSRPARGGVPR